MNQLSHEFVLANYGLHPIQMMNKGKITQIKTQQGLYALKETELTSKEREDFTYALRKLMRLGYNQIVPLYAAKNGDYTVTVGTKTFYLMPWLEEAEYTERESMEEKLASQLGVIHRLTVESHPFTEEKMEASLRQLKYRWEQMRLELSYYADEIERKIYPSPFELAYLTHAHLLERMADIALDYAQEWYDLCLEKGRYRTVLCHGQLSREHACFLSDQDPYLLNFEKSCTDSPARDLASFCRQNFPKTYWSDDEVMRWFMRYEHHLPMLDDEKYLMCAYLNFPDPIYYSMEAYVNKRHNQSELDHVMELEKKFISIRKVQRLTEALIKSSDKQT